MNNKLVKKISLNISMITTVLLVGVSLSKNPINEKKEYIEVSSLVIINGISDYFLVKTKKR